MAASAVPEIRYFEALAQLIPLVVVVGIIEGAVFATLARLSYPVRYSLLTALALLALAEIACLRVIASGDPTVGPAIMATSGLAIGVFLMFLAPTRRLWDSVPEDEMWSSKLGTVVLIAFVLALPLVAATIAVTSFIS